MTVRAGDAAPDFTLPGTDGTTGGRRTYRLSEFRGTPVVLVFYPADDSAVCTRQLVTYTKDFPSFESVDAVVLALSPQGVDRHEAFAEAQGGFAFPLLADVDKAVGLQYGVVGPLGFYKRSAFVVDATGTIRYAHRSMTGLTFRPTEELVAAVREASGG
ncbi:MAG: peroxiredoxin [Actinobacteria bacterium]|nr:peroxiredoxin [Actinomycetota bacterium]